MKLGDFGITRKQEGDFIDFNPKPTNGKAKEMNEDKGMAGTPGYWPLECLSSKFDGFAVDVWALGITYYVLLVGELPMRFKGKDEYKTLLPKFRMRYPKKFLGTAGRNDRAREMDILPLILNRKNPKARPTVSQLLTTFFSAEDFEE